MAVPSHDRRPWAVNLARLMVLLCLARAFSSPAPSLPPTPAPSPAPSPLPIPAPTATPYHRPKVTTASVAYEAGVFVAVVVAGVAFVQCVKSQNTVRTNRVAPSMERAFTSVVT